MIGIDQVFIASKVKETSTASYIIKPNEGDEIELKLVDEETLFKIDDFVFKNQGKKRVKTESELVNDKYVSKLKSSEYQWSGVDIASLRNVEYRSKTNRIHEKSRVLGSRWLTNCNKFAHDDNGNIEGSIEQFLEDKLWSLRMSTDNKQKYNVCYLPPLHEYYATKENGEYVINEFYLPVVNQKNVYEIVELKIPIDKITPKEEKNDKYLLIEQDVRKWYATIKEEYKSVIDNPWVMEYNISEDKYYSSYYVFQPQKKKPSKRFCLIPSGDKIAKMWFPEEESDIDDSYDVELFEIIDINITEKEDGISKNIYKNRKEEDQGIRVNKVFSKDEENFHFYYEHLGQYFSFKIGEKINDNDTVFLRTQTVYTSENEIRMSHIMRSKKWFFENSQFDNKSITQIQKLIENIKLSTNIDDSKNNFEDLKSLWDSVSKQFFIYDYLNAFRIAIYIRQLELKIYNEKRDIWIMSDVKVGNQMNDEVRSNVSRQMYAKCIISKHEQNPNGTISLTFEDIKECIEDKHKEFLKMIQHSDDGNTDHKKVLEPILQSVFRKSSNSCVFIDNNKYYIKLENNLYNRINKSLEDLRQYIDELHVSESDTGKSFLFELKDDKKQTLALLILTKMEKNVYFMNSCRIRDRVLNGYVSNVGELLLSSNMMNWKSKDLRRLLTDTTVEEEVYSFLVNICDNNMNIDCVKFFNIYDNANISIFACKSTVFDLPESYNVVKQEQNIEYVDDWFD